MSTKEIKDAIEAVDIAQANFRAANTAFANAKATRDATYEALSSAQNVLGQLLDGASMIGGDYILKNKGSDNG